METSGRSHSVGDMRSNRHVDGVDFIDVETDTFNTTRTPGRGISLTDSLSSGPVCIKRSLASREVFYAQTILIYIICIASLANLTIGSDYSSVWISLLSGSLAYLLPSPKVKGSTKNTVVGIPRETTTQER